jgi:hypothetical protein
MPIGSWRLKRSHHSDNRQSLKKQVFSVQSGKQQNKMIKFSRQDPRREHSQSRKHRSNPQGTSTATRIKFHKAVIQTKDKFKSSPFAPSSDGNISANAQTRSPSPFVHSSNGTQKQMQSRVDKITGFTSTSI